MRTVTVENSYLAVSPSDWDALVSEGSPFLEHAFLAALETSRCAIAETGWAPRPILVHDGDKLIAAAPGWVKTHSMGEFVYDHGWANAAQRYGIRYYPKLMVGVPFSPVTGSRLLGDPTARESLLTGIQQAGKGCHGVHVVFNTEEEVEWLNTKGLFPRVQYQFWWRNEGYATWEEFIARFPSKDRNKLRRERREIPGLRIDTVMGPSSEEIDALYRFYADTTDRHFYGNRYLNPEFFHKLRETWGDRLQAVLVREGKEIVAGALNVVKGKRLYGRYWGTSREIPFLHMEVCYHRGIDFCIENGLDVFEPGHGGEHKYKRGFLPEITWSSHALAHTGLHKALADHSAAEREAVEMEVAQLRETAPFR